MKIWAITKGRCLIKFAFSEKQKDRDKEVCGREAVTVVYRTEMEQKLAEALFNLKAGLVKCQDGYALAKINRLEKSDEEVVQGANEALSAFVGVDVVG